MNSQKFSWKVLLKSHILHNNGRLPEMKISGNHIKKYVKWINFKHNSSFDWSMCIKNILSCMETFGKKSRRNFNWFLWKNEILQKLIRKLQKVLYGAWKKHWVFCKVHLKFSKKNFHVSVMLLCLQNFTSFSKCFVGTTCNTKNLLKTSMHAPLGLS